MRTMKAPPVSFSAACAMTLVEVMVALVVIGLLLSLAGPAMNHLTAEWELRAAAHEVENQVRFAQYVAAVDGVPCQAVYDVPEGCCALRRGQDVFSRISLPKGVRFEGVRFADGTLVTADVAAIQAYPDGAVDPHEVILIAADGARIRLKFRRLTGEADCVEESAPARGA